MIVVLNDRQFGRNLRYLRKRRHYSRVELANLICPGRAGLGDRKKLRRGVIVSEKHLQVVCHSFGIPD